MKAEHDTISLPLRDDANELRHDLPALLVRQVGKLPNRNRLCDGGPDRNARAMMIEHYTDHAANERTFLAWVRTAIAVMAFGFLVERFDLFLQIAGQTLARRALSPTGQLAGNVVGLILIGLGAASIILALLRFRRTARQIDSPERLPGSGERLDLALAALLVILGTALFVYLSYTVISRF
jgi:inner membrane protein YidH